MKTALSLRVSLGSPRRHLTPLRAARSRLEPCGLVSDHTTSGAPSLSTAAAAGGTISNWRVELHPWDSYGSNRDIGSTLPVDTCIAQYKGSLTLIWHGYSARKEAYLSVQRRCKQSSSPRSFFFLYLFFLLSSVVIRRGHINSALLSGTRRF